MLPLKRIICPTDFSDFSYEAIEKGAELARHFGAELCLVHVTQLIHPIQGMSPYAGHAGFDTPEYEQVVCEGAERELGEVMARHHLNDVRVRYVVRRGSPADEIVAAADEEKADLIILPTHGLTGWRSHIFGSVAEKVMRLARCPVLLKRARDAEQTMDAVELATMPRRILCSTDWSEPSFAALQVAGEWATHFGAELCLIHVVEPMGSPGLILSREEIEESMQSDALQHLQQVLHEQLPQVASARAIVRIGSAADEIAAAAIDENADLVVIATHGASGWHAVLSGTRIEHLLFGSVATNVVRLTTCPVLTVRLPLEHSIVEVR